MSEDKPSRKEFQTELPQYKETPEKPTEKVERVLCLPENPDCSRDAINPNVAQPPNKLSSFSFERDKLRQLHIGPSNQTDVNDERIQKIKDDIFQRLKNAAQTHERYTAMVRMLGMSMMGVNALEVIVDFFMLLVLALHYIPSDLMLTWVGSSLLLTCAHTYMLSHAIDMSSERDLPRTKRFLCWSAVFLTGLLLTGIAYIGVLLGTDESERKLTTEQHYKLALAQTIFMVGVGIKLVSQVLFVWMGLEIKKQVGTLAMEELKSDRSTSVEDNRNKDSERSGTCVMGGK